MQRKNSTHFGSLWVEMIWDARRIQTPKLDDMRCLHMPSFRQENCETKYRRLVRRRPFGSWAPDPTSAISWKWAIWHEAFTHEIWWNGEGRCAVSQCLPHFFTFFSGFDKLYVVGLGKSHSLTKSDLDVLSTNDWEEGGGAGRVINASMNPSQLFLLTWCLTKECKRKPTDVVKCNVRSTPRVTIWDDHQSSRRVLWQPSLNHFFRIRLATSVLRPTLKFGFDLLGL